ncbi:class I SAM-dependent methyltransferase [Fodinicola feengrottensis]|uniref:Class I SAM-dependent methyltransferase n=2 Tax=Fodinicola feengrottensis TaxID=435914 RepID=A0ABP4U2Q5_9ACTN
MNLRHQELCSSQEWADAVGERLDEWLTTTGRDIGNDIVEIGPGFGATTRVLVRHCERLTAIEIDPDFAAGLRAEFGDQVTIINASGADVPLASASYSGVVCFTMLHHVPSVELQDQIFAEAYRLLRPGGVVAGADGQDSEGFRALHEGDIMVVVEPDSFPDRLRAAGFTDIDVTVDPGVILTFHARKPGP